MVRALYGGMIEPDELKGLTENANSTLIKFYNKDGTSTPLLRSLFEYAEERGGQDETTAHKTGEALATALGDCKKAFSRLGVYPVGDSRSTQEAMPVSVVNAMDRNALHGKSQEIFDTIESAKDGNTESMSMADITFDGKVKMFASHGNLVEILQASLVDKHSERLEELKKKPKKDEKDYAQMIILRNTIRHYQKTLAERGSAVSVD